MENRDICINACIVSTFNEIIESYIEILLSTDEVKSDFEAVREKLMHTETAIYALKLSHELSVNNYKSLHNRLVDVMIMIDSILSEQEEGE